MSPVIVIPAFSREKSLERLLQSIINSDAPLDNLEIIISLDGGYHSSVLDVAEDFIKNNCHLSVELFKREKNIGLKEHILWCGDLTEKYGSVIVLEDDLIVSKDFYRYTLEALEFYRNDVNVAGIALYGQKYNEYANLPFEPMPNGSDVFFMQVACSWGQAWTKSQWKEFREWYAQVDSDYIKKIIELPDSVSNWPETSWKKFFSAYIVEKDKYFVYPYVSRTSNCADTGGQHTKNQINYLQVPLSLKGFCEFSFNFSDFNNDNQIKYDAFMEAELPIGYSVLGLDSDLIAIDLYGTKPKELLNKFKYAITSKRCSKHIAQIDVRFKPIENNFILYDNESIVNTKFFFSLCESEYVLPRTKLHNVTLHYHFSEYFSYFKLKTRKFTLSYLFSLLRIYH